MRVQIWVSLGNWIQCKQTSCVTSLRHSQARFAKLLHFMASDSEPPKLNCKESQQYRETWNLVVLEEEPLIHCLPAVVFMGQALRERSNLRCWKPFKNDRTFSGTVREQLLGHQPTLLESCNSKRNQTAATTHARSFKLQPF